MDSKTEEEKIEHIIKALTETYPHDFIITRDVASRIGLKTINPSLDEEKLIMNLFASYEAEFRMNMPFDAEDFLARQSSQQRAQVPPTQAPQPIPTQMPMQAMAPQPSRAFNFKVKIGAIEDTTDSFTLVADGSVYPPVQNVMQMGGGQTIPLPAVNFKYGTWLRYKQLEGMSFE